MKRKSTATLERVTQRERAVSAEQVAWHVKQTRSNGMTRRQFITRAAAAGLALGTPPLLSACGDSDDGVASEPGWEQRTLFFNFAHENPAGKDYFLVGGGRRYALTRTVDAPRVLARARRTNAFLRGVPDDQITHHVEGGVFADDSVTLCHVGATIDRTAGTWSMSSVYLHIPETGSAHAYAKARERTPTGPLPLSAKRELYGHGAAMTLQDVREEGALVDTTSHAATLIMMHPDLLSGEPNSAHNVYTNHAGVGGLTKRLARTLTTLGPAMPQIAPNQPNASGWATLQPLLNESPTGIAGPIRNQKGTNAGQIQYFPDWHADVDQDAASAVTYHINNVKNDASLGTVVTRGTGAPAATDVAGLLWFRHEGFTAVDPASTSRRAVGDGSVAMTLVDQSPENGLDVTATFTSSSGGVTASVTLANWYLRYLGVYVQFLNDKNPPDVIPLKNLSAYPNNILPDHNAASDTDTEMFAGIVPPEFTILAIPVDAGYATLSINVPKEASRVRILSSGLANNDSNNYPETIVLGIVLTAAINYGLNIFFLAAGASAKLSPFQRAVIVPIAALFAKELVTLIGAEMKGTNDPAAWKGVGTTLLKAVLNVATSTLMRGVVIAIVAIVTESTLEDSIPVAGLIMRAIACVVGFADIAHTTADIDLSPWTYVKDLVFTHDLSVTLAPDPAHNVFPVAASQYKVTAMFEDGTPHVQTFSIPNPGPASLPPVVFPNVPLGGKVNVSVAFAQPATSPSADDILLGKGTTGLVPNTATDPVPTLAITEIKFPIGPTTIYQHQQKTTLAAGPTPGQPVHVWTTTKTAPTTQAIDNGNLPGDLSALNSITVRQGTSKPPQNGYLGYSWRAFSSGVTECGVGGRNQLDQLTNLNSDGGQAQNGYVNGACGLQSGVRLAYNLLSHGSANFYLDTSAGLIRQVHLEPTPSFDDPKNMMAWGKLNFASNALLLHPSGKLVSISTADHQMETLKIADGPLPDDQATVHLLARRHLGHGNQPGLLSSPVAAAISPDGVVLVLEQGNNRIQALDVGANPVKFFGKQVPSYFFNLTATAGGNTQYLDLAVEYTGFLYVLSVSQGQTSSVYRLDIYHPQQAGTTPISTTTNVNAGRLTVDFWRNVYTLNYEVLQLNGAFPALTEPSVSLWTPCNVGQTC